MVYCVEIGNAVDIVTCFKRTWQPGSNFFSLRIAMKTSFLFVCFLVIMSGSSSLPESGAANTTDPCRTCVICHIGVFYI